MKDVGWLAARASAVCLVERWAGKSAIDWLADENVAI